MTPRSEANTVSSNRVNGFIRLRERKERFLKKGWS